MKTTINSEIKGRLKPNSSTRIAARHVSRHGKTGPKAKQNLGKAKENAWLLAHQ